MDSQTRLKLIRERAKQRLPLSESAAETLAEIRKEDSELGGIVDFATVLASESIVKDSIENEDESDENVELISPLMRKACDMVNA
jgi:hypothetical protein